MGSIWKSAAALKCMLVLIFGSIGCSLLEPPCISPLGLGYSQSDHSLTFDLAVSSGEADNIRLNGPKAWRPTNISDSFVEINISQPVLLSALQVQGDIRLTGQITAWQLDTSLDCVSYRTQNYSLDTVSPVNTQTAYLRNLEFVNCIRLRPTHFKGKIPALRLELLGCVVQDSSTCGRGAYPTTDTWMLDGGRQLNFAHDIVLSWIKIMLELHAHGDSGDAAIFYSKSCDEWSYYEPADTSVISVASSDERTSWMTIEMDKPVRARCLRIFPPLATTIREVHTSDCNSHLTSSIRQLKSDTKVKSNGKDSSIQDITAYQEDAPDVPHDIEHKSQDTNSLTDKVPVKHDKDKSELSSTDIKLRDVLSQKQTDAPTSEDVAGVSVKISEMDTTKAAEETQFPVTTPTSSTQSDTPTSSSQSDTTTSYTQSDTTTSSTQSDTTTESQSRTDAGRSVEFRSEEFSSQYSTVTSLSRVVNNSGSTDVGVTSVTGDIVTKEVIYSLVSNASVLENMLTFNSSETTSSMALNSSEITSPENVSSGDVTNKHQNVPITDEQNKQKSAIADDTKTQQSMNTDSQNRHQMWTTSTNVIDIHQNVTTPDVQNREHNLTADIITNKLNGTTAELHTHIQQTMEENHTKSSDAYVTDNSDSRNQTTGGYNNESLDEVMNVTSETSYRSQQQNGTSSTQTLDFGNLAANESQSKFSNSGRYQQECGKKPWTKGTRKKRVISGKINLPWEWPWLVSMHYLPEFEFTSKSGFKHICGASILSPEWIITAAHCFSDEIHSGLGNLTSWRIYSGIHDQAREDNQNFVQERLIEEIFFYPEYNIGVAPLIYDLALVKLNQPVQFNERTSPVCLDDTNRYYEESQCYVTGWGQITPNSTGSRFPYTAALSILTLGTCRNMYNILPDDHEIKPYIRIESPVLCATVGTRGEDACKGDSGGPLMCEHDGRWYQAGVIAAGYLCGHEATPGLYTRISYYMDWIRATMNI